LQNNILDNAVKIFATWFCTFVAHQTITVICKNQADAEDQFNYRI